MGKYYLYEMESHLKAKGCKKHVQKTLYNCTPNETLVFVIVKETSQVRLLDKLLLIAVIKVSFVL